MGLTITNKTSKYNSRQRVLDHISSKLKISVKDITFDSSYPTGGESITASDVGSGFTELIGFFPQLSTGGVDGSYVLNFNPSTSKLEVYYVDADYAGDRPLKEVPNGTDLSSETFKCLIVGY